MTRRVVVLAFAWAFMILSGVAFGREGCKTPLFITTSVSPNVLISGVSGAGKSYLLCFILITMNRGHYATRADGRLTERRPITFVFDKGMTGQPCGFEKVAKLFGGRIRWRRVIANLTGREAAGPAPSAGGRNLRDSVEDIPASLAKYDSPMLFVFGGGDEEGSVAMDHFEAFAEANLLPAYFHVVEGSNHNFYSAEWTRQLIERTLDFLAVERS